MSEEPKERERDEDLDDALEALFDEPSTPSNDAKCEHAESPQAEPPHATKLTPPSTPQETRIPQTPEPSPKKPRRKGILEHLKENKNRLSASALRVAEDLQKLANERSKGDGKDGEKNALSGTNSRDKEKESSIKEAMAARRRKIKTEPSRKAFTVIGKDNQPLGSAHAIKTFEYLDPNVTNMSLIEAPYEKARLEAIFEHTYRLDIADIHARYEDLYTGALKDYTVFGCLVKKISKKQSKKGNMFAIWSLCNMPRTRLADKEVKTTVTRLYLFDDAYETFHTRCEGTVFALRRPGLFSGGNENDENRSQSSLTISLRISKKDSIAVLGVCRDFKLCESRRANGELCGQWYHSDQLTNCPTHEMTRKRGLYTGTRMDIQNAVRPGLRDPIKSIRIPLDISSSTREKEVVEQGDADLRVLRDSKRAREMRKRGRTKRRQTLQNGHTTISPAVQGGLTKRTAGKGLLTNGIRGSRLGRNRPGARHDRLQDRSERQSSYHLACQTLHRFGFRLRADGGWDPPEDFDIPLVTAVSHKFSGLGKVMLSFGGDMADAKNETEGDGESEATEFGHGENRDQGGDERLNSGDTRQEDHAKMDVDSEERNNGSGAVYDDESKTLTEDARMEGEENAANGRTDDADNDEGNLPSNTKNTTIPTAPSPPQPAHPLPQQYTSKAKEDIILSDESSDDE